jgi:hypothetical protein
MKRILSSIALLCLAASASAQLVVVPGTPKTFSGYDGQPASVTGSLSNGVQGTLASLFPAAQASFTYLGNESGNVNLFTFAVGSQTLTEASALGASISGAIGPGAVGFSFTDTTTGFTFGNGDLSIVYVPNVTTIGLPVNQTFDYVIGFNDNGSPDGDFDDFVVGVHVTPVPEPETYALMLGGLSAIGMFLRRRRATA